MQGQDIIVKKTGDEIKAKVEEVLDTEIKYRKFENLAGPLYSMPKAEIFMIKYENGSKDVFGGETQVAAPVTAVTAPSGTPAIIYFFRPGKMAGSINDIIVGTYVPDEVIVNLKNARWYRSEYASTGPREFITGIFSISDKKLNVDIEPGKTYYIRCSIMKGFGMQSQLELVDEQTAKSEMNSLKEQTEKK